MSVATIEVRSRADVATDFVDFREPERIGLVVTGLGRALRVDEEGRDLTVAWLRVGSMVGSRPDEVYATGQPPLGDVILEPCLRPTARPAGSSSSGSRRGLAERPAGAVTLDPGWVSPCGPESVTLDRPKRRRTTRTDRQGTRGTLLRATGKNRHRRHSAFGGDPVSFADKTLTCRDCGQEFIWTAGEQEFYASRGLQNAPSRCPADRAARRASGGGGGGGGYGGGGYGGGGGGAREMFSATCSNCGREARVPFQPRGDKPVYCSDCFEKMRGSSRGGGRY